MMTPRGFKARARGFSLFEVLVGLIVISIGLLGISKMHALAYASTATASRRSLAAIEASSLASAMHANRIYWSGLAPTSVTITTTPTSISISDSTLATPANCTSATTPCSSAQLAAYDLQRWAASLRALLPNAAARIDCPATAPITCSVQVTWSDKTVAIQKQAVTATETTLYQQFVEP